MSRQLLSSFMAQSLHQYNTDVITGIRAAARKAGVGVTDEGVNSLAYQVFKSDNPRSELSFNEYLRMVDMGAGRGHPIGGITATRAALKNNLLKGTGVVQQKDTVRRPKKIYSKVAYGKLTWLQNKLLYGFTEETIEQLKTELQNGNSSSIN
jgi:hypothetical protein